MNTSFFNEIEHIILSIIIFLLSLAIFFRADNLYSKNKCPNMLILGSGFLFGGLLEFIHLFYSLNIIHNSNGLNESEFLYVLLSRLFISSSVLISAFYITTEAKNTASKLKIKIYSIQAVMFLTLILFIEILSFNQVNFYGSSLQEVVLKNPSILVLSNIFFLLSTFLYLDLLRQNKEKKPHNLFLIGLFILGIGQIYLLTASYPESFYRYVIHLVRAFAYLLIFLGITGAQLKSEIYFLRHKILVFPVLLLAIFQLMFNTFSILALKIKYPVIIQYFYVIFYIITIFLTYLLSKRITKPISNLITEVKDFEPAKKPEKLKILSKDEIGFLTGKFNERAELIWEYTQNLKLSNEREKLLRKIIETIRSSLDIDEIKNSVVIEVGKSFNADRCYFRTYDKKSNKFLAPKIEYLSSPEIKSLVDVEPEQESLQYFSNQRKGLSTIEFRPDNLNETAMKTYLMETGAKATYAIPLWDEPDELTYLVLHYVKELPYLEKEDIALLETIARQIEIAISQAESYDFTKKQIEKERILRLIIDAIRSSLDIKEIKRIFATEMGKLFNAQRCFILEFGDYNKIDEYSEYRSSLDIKSFVDVTIENEGLKYWVPVVKREDFIISDMDKYINERHLENTPAQEILLEFDIKAALAFKIIYKDNLFGVFALHFNTSPVFFTEEDVKIIRAIVDQTSLAFYQARQFEKEKKTAEREKLLANILSKALSTFDMNQFKQIVKDIGTYTNADRCYFVEVDLEKTKGKPIDNNAEYLGSSDMKSVIGYEFPSEDVEQFVDLYVKSRDLVVFDYEKIIEENKEQSKGVIKYSKTFNLKSGIGIPFIYMNELLAVLAIEFSNKKVLFAESELNFLRILGNQIGIAYSQAKLYEKEKKTAERERTLREIIAKTKSTFDVNEIKNSIVNSIGTLMKTNRCFIIELDEVKDKFLLVNNEYRDNKNTKSVMGVLPEDEIPEMMAKFKKGELFINNTDAFVDEYKLENTQTAKFLYDYDIMSGFAIPILYRDKIQGILVLHFNRKFGFDEEDVQFIKTFADQAGLVIYQAKLFETVKNNAYKERILREIVTEIKISENLNTVYEYITDKVSNIYNAQRSFFIEFSDAENELPSIKYQFLKDSNTKNIEISQMPLRCLKSLIETANKEDIAFMKNTEQHYKDDEELQGFFKEYNIKSVILILLTRYNHDEKNLGALVLCFDTKRDWSEDELSLLKSIAGSTVNILWEIKKQIELEELRNVFILTLTHDLQVPLVGEKKALEFIASRPKDMQIGKLSEIINDLINSNENLIILLKKLLDSYNYESEKKELNLKEQNIANLIDDTVDYFRYYAAKKNITIEVKIQENLPLIYMDAEEIKKVLKTLLENAVDYIQEYGKISVRCYKQKNRIVFSISDNGPGIPAETKEKIFERYAMALTIERKIGAGLGLYLSKQIIEAHKGNIWFESELNIGTTFYFSLPL
jgi:GAF domain-containing protein